MTFSLMSQRSRSYTFLFRQPWATFRVEADSTRDALAIALEQTGYSTTALIEIREPDPDDPYNLEAYVSLAGAALDFWL